MLLSVCFVLVDITVTASHYGSSSGVNPYWKFALVFKCTADALFLDDFKHVLDNLCSFAMKRVSDTERGSDLDDCRRDMPPRVSMGNGQLAHVPSHNSTEREFWHGKKGHRHLFRRRSTSDDDLPPRARRHTFGMFTLHSHLHPNDSKGSPRGGDRKQSVSPSSSATKVATSHHIDHPRRPTMEWFDTPAKPGADSGATARGRNMMHVPGLGALVSAGPSPMTTENNTPMHSPDGTRSNTPEPRDMLKRRSGAPREGQLGLREALEMDEKDFLSKSSTPPTTSDKDRRSQRKSGNENLSEPKSLCASRNGSRPPSRCGDGRAGTEFVTSALL
jgi:hypothetical protein